MVYIYNFEIILKGYHYIIKVIFIQTKIEIYSILLIIFKLFRNIIRLHLFFFLYFY